jgi:ubiquinone/menaquinone biosynthesis C-methylase UbiE
VLDFGCGIGSITIPAARAVGRRGRVIALDVKEGQLNHIRKKVTGTGLEHRIDFVKTSGAPEFPGVVEDSLDAVFVFDVLQHVEDWDGLFGQCGTALKANGRLHINASELSHPGKVDIQAMQQILEKRGFREAGRLQTRLMHYKHMTDDVVRSYE